MRFASILLALALAAPVLCAGPDGMVRAQAAGKTAVSLANLRPDGSPDADLFLQVLTADLNRSGWLQATTAPGAAYRVDGVVSGGATPAANLRISGQNSSVPWFQQATAGDIRTLAHNASDEIVLRLTGHKGMASAPILLVGKRNGRTDIYRCDADGQRMRGVTGEGVLCLSPTWLPDRSGFIYSSFVKRYAAVYQTQFTPNGGISRTLVAGYPGLNNGGIVSPDGRYLALVLSYTGNVELYIQNRQTKRLIRLTKTPHASEASPDWSPDSQTLAYVSDETGKPQVYVLSSQGSRKGRRLVSGLQESVAPDWSPDGSQIAFCGKSGGVYGIYTCPASGGPFKLVSPHDGSSYQDPSWAPDGRHIVASRGRDGQRTLVLLDSMGDNPVNLTPYPGEWYLPDWAK